MHYLLFIIIMPFFLLGVIPTTIFYVMEGKSPGLTRDAIDFYMTSVIVGVFETFLLMFLSLVWVLIYK